MDDHAELADEHEETADRLERESERTAETGDEARSKLEAARGESMIPESLGDEDPGHRQPSEADQKAEQREQEEAEAQPDTIGESIDASLSDTELGQGGERGRDRHDQTDETPGGGDVDDPPDKAGGDSDDDED